MNAPPTSSMLRALPSEHRQQLMRVALEVSFPEGRACSRRAHARTASG